MTRERVNQFAEEHNITNDEAITAMIQFYQTRTRYNFSIEAAEVLSELQTIEQEMFTILKLVFDINSGVRRLVEIKESGILHAFEKIQSSCLNSENQATNNGIQRSR